MAKLYFYYAAMNAGKSTMLLQAKFNYEERGMQVKTYLPSIINQTKVVSRIGLETNATVFFPETDFLSFAFDDVSCILVDEAQFLTQEQVYQLFTVAARRGVPVLCYGLRTDFRGHVFDGSAALLGLADQLFEVRNVCSCGRKATMNCRVGDDGVPVREGTQVQIGGNDMYKAMCKQCFLDVDSYSLF